MANILFLHPHPDDEAIFAGGTIAQLVSKGHRVHIAFATSGELGINPAHNIPLDSIRQKEALAAAKALGVPEENCHFLGYSDSGMDLYDCPEGSFAQCKTMEAAERLVEIIDTNHITTLVCDDKNGIYGHPDHLKAHKVGVAVLKIRSELELIFVTVDREHLHFLETQHVVQNARATYEIGDGKNGNVQSENHTPTPLSRLKDFGTETVEITYVIDTSRFTGVKRQAMALHESQLPPGSLPLQMDARTFAEVYGIEYFVCGQPVKESPFNDLDQTSIFHSL